MLKFNGKHEKTCLLGSCSVTVGDWGMCHVSVMSDVVWTCVVVMSRSFVVDGAFFTHSSAQLLTTISQAHKIY